MEDWSWKKTFIQILDIQMLCKVFFECITSCIINSEGVDCTTACYVKHLEQKNIESISFPHPSSKSFLYSFIASSINLTLEPFITGLLDRLKTQP